MNANSENDSTIHVMLGGDVMLGRIVKEHIQTNGPEYPLGRIANLMRQADLTIVNLECAITVTNEIWQGEPKSFYFGAPPQAIHSLIDAGVDMVSLANNHALDFGIQGLLETLRHLHHHGIRYAGAGVNIDGAHSPTHIHRHGIRFGMAAFCDHQPDFAAEKTSPGIAYLDLNDEQSALVQFRKALEFLQKDNIDWPILSLHWGPNMVFRPSEQFKRLAHAAIDMGWKILFGHSAHVFQGIEIYKGCPILYATGDLVDDYYVDPEFKNDHQMLFELMLTRSKLKNIRLHPIFIEDCRTQPASGAQFEYIVKWISTLCSELGTKVQRENNRVWIEPT